MRIGDHGANFHSAISAIGDAALTVPPDEAERKLDLARLGLGLRNLLLERRWKASRPSIWRSTRIVSRGAVIEAQGRSSKPTTAKSSGTDMPSPPPLENSDGDHVVHAECRAALLVVSKRRLDRIPRATLFDG